MGVLFRAGACGLLSLAAFSAAAADYPAPQEGDWVVENFRFHTGETLPALRLHYITVGDPAGRPVLILHGTSGSGASMLTAGFAGELFGPGQPLDARKYFIILPDAIGAGHSSKPSDGLHMKFPRYDYGDIVMAQYRLLTEHLGIRHLRLVMGNSMGGMVTWSWGVKYPAFMDGLVPLASQPSAMASRNWALRRMTIETIKRDPDWKDGNYTSQPRSAAHRQCVLRPRHQRRHPRLGPPRAHARSRRPHGRCATGGAGCRRRQRHHLFLRRLARL